jgi:hypothetical protein
VENEVLRLRSRVRELEAECKALKKELEARKPFDAEFFIAKLTGGDIKANHHDPYDVLLENGLRVQVKYSHLNKPNPSKTRRWNWGKPLGLLDRTGDYDFLVLVGEKDNRYEDRYPPDSRYVLFLVPRKDVLRVANRGGAGGLMIALNTNLASVRARTSQALRDYLVPETKIKELAQKPAAPPSQLPM